MDIEVIEATNNKNYKIRSLSLFKRPINKETKEVKVIFRSNSNHNTEEDITIVTSESLSSSITSCRNSRIHSSSCSSSNNNNHNNKKRRDRSVIIILFEKTVQRTAEIICNMVKRSLISPSSSSAVSKITSARSNSKQQEEVQKKKLEIMKLKQDKQRQKHQKQKEVPEDDDRNDNNDNFLFLNNINDYLSCAVRKTTTGEYCNTIVPTIINNDYYRSSLHHNRQPIHSNNNTKSKNLKGILKKEKTAYTKSADADVIGTTTTNTAATSTNNNDNDYVAIRKYPDRQFYYYDPTRNNNENPSFDDSKKNHQKEREKRYVSCKEPAEEKDKSLSINSSSNRSVSFSSVDVKEFLITLGDHPNVATGPPIRLDYNAGMTNEQKFLSLDEYESYRQQSQSQQSDQIIMNSINDYNAKSNTNKPKQRRNRNQLRLSLHDRTNLLIHDRGFTYEEIDIAWMEAIKIQKQRQETIDRSGYFLSTIDNIIETFYNIKYYNEQSFCC